MTGVLWLFISSLLLFIAAILATKSTLLRFILGLLILLYAYVGLLL